MRADNVKTARAMVLACTATLCLSGCVAAAIPIAAGGLIGGKGVLDSRNNDRSDAAEIADARVVIPADAPPTAISFDTEEPEDAAPDRMARAITIGTAAGTGPSIETTVAALPTPVASPTVKTPANDTSESEPLAEGSNLVPAPAIDANTDSGLAIENVATTGMSEPGTDAALELAPAQADPAQTPIVQATTPAASVETMAPGALAAIAEVAETSEPIAIAPAVPTGPNAYADFLNFARDQAGASPASPLRRSALLSDPGSLLPLKAQCPVGAPGAIMIDLDQDKPATNKPIDPRLATSLESLRSEGVAVLWISERSAVEAGALRTMLSESGLDPDGQDELLLTFGDQRKQTRRAEAAADYCILAIAGDERSDFDELYEYLRTPISAQALESMIGDGWFLVPTPSNESVE